MANKMTKDEAKKTAANSLGKFFCQTFHIFESARPRLELTTVVAFHFFCRVEQMALAY
jgi:hypothetical protein